MYIFPRHLILFDLIQFSDDTSLKGSLAVILTLFCKISRHSTRNIEVKNAVNTKNVYTCESYVYWTVHHLDS